MTTNPTAGAAVIRLASPFPPPLDRLHHWEEGDCVTALDGRLVEDMLDLYYYQPEDRQLMLTIRRRGGQEVTLALPPESLPQITEAFAPMEFRTCACHCVFCFIDQNPRGMRPPIYVKDEDYRFSFLYGNYITLTSLGRRGLARILAQRMTPLFVSVHATDTDVRTRLLGIKRRIDVLPILARLVEGGITVHTQVVLCPGWNDGAVLDRTIGDLLSLHPGVASLAIVPVGLTAHRDGLTRLDPVTPEIARRVIDQVAPWQERAREQTGATFVQLSDEFYLLADAPFPPASSYDDFPQVDNGIGLTMHLRESWRDALADARDEGRLPRRPVTILTGREPLLRLFGHGGRPPLGRRRPPRAARAARVAAPHGPLALADVQRRRPDP
jgi:putative radical SAM enzyme (TIGR03279 family)